MQNNESPVEIVRASSSGSDTGFMLWIAVFLIVAGLTGCLTIYSALAFSGDMAAFQIRQLIYLVPGIFLFIASALIPFSWYRRAALPLLLFQIFLLLTVLFYGPQINGMHGWFQFGKFYIQPSEFSKAVLLLYLCVYCGPKKEMKLADWIRILAASALMIFLILLEPDFGSALVFFAIFFIIVFLRGIKIYYFTAAIGMMILSALLFLLHNDYALKRILGFLYQDANSSGNAWHIRQFQYTMAHGGWAGADWGNTLWSGAFLPLPHTDSLYASIVEASGFIGGSLIILAFLILAVTFCILSWKIKGENDDRRFFVFCTGGVIAVQALIHISVNCTLIPPTGITLPILSYGGSSLFSLMFTFGIACSALRSREETPEKMIG